MPRSAADDDSPALKIGAVARLTGVSVHTLRKWEDRYGAVEPHRSEGGERVYTRTDLKRLGYIKRLSDAGLSLREIAGMSLEALERAWKQAGGMQAVAGPSSDAVRIAILGDVLPALLAQRDVAPAGIEVVASGDSIRSLSDALGDSPIDLVVYECPAVHAETRQRVTEVMKELSARGAVVVYGFGAQVHVSALRRSNVAVMRAPVDTGELAQVARGVCFGVASTVGAHADTFTIAADSDIPAPRLSRETIARVAMSAPKMRCECPHHLADIVLSLRAFEEYSEECENRNPDDAELHHFLWLSAAKARAQFEEAIIRVAEVEGISLED